MAKRDVRNLVSDYPRQLAFVSCRCNRARVDEDISARQGERIDLFGGDDLELVREIEARCFGSETRPEQADVVYDSLVTEERDLLCNFPGGLPAELYILLRGKEIETRFEVRSRTRTAA